VTALALAQLSVTLGSYKALEAVSCQVPAGAFLAILGPNGSGKSTLLRTVLGLTETYAGSVTVLGSEPARVPAGWIGYVPQVKTLDRNFPALAEDLVLSGILRRWPWRSTHRERDQALAALKAVGAGQLAGRAVGWLSGGELQRVYLARAIARRPRLLLLDEPAAGIDAGGEADMYHLLEHWRAEHGGTVVMVTHDWGAAYHHASHALVLNRSVIAYGAPVSVLTDDHLRLAFGHAGHHHGMAWRGDGHA
jgi:zinc transport system ATP-binding protein